MKMIKNKYKKYYFLMILKAKNRKPLQNVLTEKHHIIPVSLGGNNDKKNIVVLSIREHVYVHHILTKFLTGLEKAKMCHSYFRMVKGRQGKLIKLSYEKQKELMLLYSDARKKMRIGKKHSEEVKKKIGLGNLGKKLSDLTKKKISLANTGRLLGVPKPKYFGKKISLALTGLKKSIDHVNKINKNPEKIRKTAEKHRGMKRSLESRQRMRESALIRIKKSGGPWNKGLKLINGEYKKIEKLQNVN